jgi:hypothetical protein
MECASTSIVCQLDRIADSMSGFDGDTFWATLLATILGAVVAALIGLYVARRDKPQPYFRVDAAQPTNAWSGEEGAGTVGVVVTVANIGDGSAYDFQMTVPGDQPEASTVRASKLEPGGTLDAVVHVPVSGEDLYDVENGRYTDYRKAHWRRTIALVSWQVPPQRGRIQRSQLAVENPFSESRRA